MRVDYETHQSMHPIALTTIGFYAPEAFAIRSVHSLSEIVLAQEAGNTRLGK